MAQNSKIEWTHHTANLWWGCTEVHAGCDNCYARVLSHRWGQELWGNDSPRREIKSVWNDLDRYQKMAAEAGEMHRVFVGSMMDIFEKPMPLIDSKGNPNDFDTDYLRTILFEAIQDGRYPNLLFLFLTKRPSNINKYIPEAWKTDCPENVMFGTSPVNQETADKLIPQLLEAPGRKFLSVEPMLGPVNFSKVFCNRFCDEGIRCQEECYYTTSGLKTCKIKGIDWVICGGESGPGARPMHPDWARSLRDQCKRAGVPFFFKQWGEYSPGLVPGNGDEPEYFKVGKKVAGRLLDGVLHDEFPNN